MARIVTAARLHEAGRPLRIEEVRLREPGPDEVTVSLSFAALNPLDLYTAAGTVGGDAPVPRTLGVEGAGYIEGRPVLVTGEGLGITRDGTFASAVTCPRACVVEAQRDDALPELASMGVAGLTAWDVVTRAAEVGRRDRVLVLGAGGGVGLPIVSLAASNGAETWGQVGDPAKVTAVREAGAVEVLVGGADYLRAEAAKLSPTVVFDPLGGLFTPAALSVLAPRGRLVSFGTSAGADVSFNLRSFYRNGQRIVGYISTRLTTEERRASLQEALQAFATGRLRVTVTQLMPLPRVNEAFGQLAGRKIIGKLVLALS